MTIEELRLYLLATFDYKDGFLYFKIKTSNKVWVGKMAGGLKVDENRYRISIGKKRYYLSRAIFLFHKGYLPDFVDHIDLDTLNNRIENLRECKHIDNMRNVKKRTNSPNKYKGVFLRKPTNKFVVKLGYCGKKLYMGQYDTENEAVLVYNKNAVRLFKEFAFLNIIQP